MRPDSLSFLGVNLPAGALPWPILAILLIGFFVIIGLGIQKAAAFKSYASADFPTHAATVIVALSLSAATAPIVLSRVALGMDSPGGTGDWLAFVAALAGATIVGLGAKRFSSTEYMDGKANVAGAKAAATPPQVTAEGDVNVTSERRVVTGERATDKPAMPQAGVRPSAEIASALEQAAGMSAFGGTSND